MGAENRDVTANLRLERTGAALSVARGARAGPKIGSLGSRTRRTDRDPAPGASDGRRSRRTALLLLVAATAVGSLGLAAGGTAGSLLIAQMTGSEALAGLPLGLSVTGSIVGVFVVVRRTRDAGRAAGLALGYGVGAVGAATVVAGARLDSLGFVLGGSLLLGTANAAVFLTRYAAVAISGRAAGGRMLGLILFATAVGATGSPSLIVPSGRLVGPVGIPRLAGIYVLAGLSFAVAGALLSLLSRLDGSDPVAEAPGAATGRDPLGTGRRVLAEARAIGVRQALVVLACVNFVMVTIMAIMPAHLQERDHGLNFIGLVVSVHVLCMLAPAPLVGWVADRAGGVAVATSGIVLLVAAGLTGVITADHRGDVAIVCVLGLLGLGWNAGVVGAGVLLSAAARTATQPELEGAGEVAMDLAAALAAPLAGGLTAVAGLRGLFAFATVLAILALGTLPHRPQGRTGKREARGDGASALAPAPGAVAAHPSRSNRFRATHPSTAEGK